MKTKIQISLPFKFTQVDDHTIEFNEGSIRLPEIGIVNHDELASFEREHNVNPDRVYSIVEELNQRFLGELIKETMKVDLVESKIPQKASLKDLPSFR
jgi:hypothetical protein